MGGTCSTYRGELHPGFCWEDPGVYGKIILRWVFRKWDVDIDWIDVAQNMDRWRTLVNEVKNFRVP